MKQTISILILFILISCSKEDSQTQEQTLDGGTVFTSQLVTINIDNASQEEYQATLGDINLTVLRISDNTIGFQVPPNAPIELSTLQINELNNLRVVYDIRQTTLVNTPEETLSELDANIETFVSTLDAGTDADYVNSAISSFNGFYETADDTQKQTMAVFYQANKQLFNDIVLGDFTNGRAGDSDAVVLLKHKLATLAFGSGVAVAILAVDPASKGLGALVAIVAWKKSKDFILDLTSRKLKKVNFVIDGLISDIQNRTIITDIDFINGVSKTLTLSSLSRDLTNSDSNDNTNGFTTFFTGFDLFNTSINMLNNVITFVNDNVFFVSIGLIDNTALNNVNPEEEISSVQSVFDALQFSVESSNVEITSVSFDNGSINLTVDIIDLSLLDVNPFYTDLNYTYNDEFNNVNGTFPIKICLDEPFDYLGSWILREYSTLLNRDVFAYKIVFDSSGNSTLVEAADLLNGGSWFPSASTFAASFSCGILSLEKNGNSSNTYKFIVPANWDGYTELEETEVDYPKWHFVRDY